MATELANPRRGRLVLLATLLGVSLLAVPARVLVIQQQHGEEYGARKRLQSETSVRLEARRGRLLDREGRVLARDIKGFSIYSDSASLEEMEDFAPALRRELGRTPQSYLDHRESRGFIWIARGLREEKRPLFENVGGFTILDVPVRDYPYGSRAAHVIGLCSVDHEGIEGMEFALEERLRGRPGRERARRYSARGEVLSRRPPVHGEDVALSIDIELQGRVENALGELTDTNLASAVVVDPATGEILVLANRPGFDPNHPGRSSSHDRDRNLATRWLVDCGPICLLATVAAEVDESGEISRERLSVLRSALRQGMVQRFAEARGVPGGARAFGFGVDTGIELFEEKGGLLEGAVRERVTLLQLARMLGVFVDRGRRQRLTLLRDSEASETGSSMVIFSGVADLFTRLLTENESALLPLPRGATVGHVVWQSEDKMTVWELVAGFVARSEPDAEDLVVIAAVSGPWGADSAPIRSKALRLWERITYDSARHLELSRLRRP